MTTEILLTTALLLFLTIAVPMYLALHFITKWKQTREFSRDDEQMLENLWQLSQRLEDRLETLERILDDDLPRRRRSYESTHVEH
ncbi:MAG: envelope stress response membrane protein PspB [Gammaproteobacteria bacterium]|nr:envelope stress response membrane protein PspB [Gammaproteobacteria bacterium]